MGLAFLVLSWFCMYGFALWDKVADGVNEPPVLSSEMLNPANESRPLRLVVIVALSMRLPVASPAGWLGRWSAEH